jgi:hypothetical protein
MAVNFILKYQFTVVSYNSRGLRADKRAYLQHLLGQADLLMLQEHWLSSQQINKLQSDYPDFFVLWYKWIR